MKILVTGGTGFVGSNLVRRLIAEGHEVTITGHETENSVPGVKKVLHLGLDGLDWKFVEGIDVCFHQSANNNTLDMDEKEMYRANVQGPIRLFHAMAETGCNKFVYASSTAVYGDSPAPYIEDTTPIAPLNPYGCSKAAFDEFAMKFAKEENKSVIGLRYCNVYGPGESHKGKRASMIHQLYQQIKNKKKPVLFKDGEQKRDWLFIGDAVEANLAAMRYEGSGIFNIGSGIATSFNQVIHLIRKALDEISSTIKYIDNPNEAAYQDFTQCDITKAQKELKWVPKTNLSDGIRYMMSDG